MGNETFSLRAASYTSPAERLAPVTPNDAADLPDGLCRGLFVGVAGAVAVLDRFGTRVELISLGGQYHPVRVRRVLAAGTDAGGIVALY